MRIHYIQHVPFEELGFLKVLIEKQDFKLSVTKVFENVSFPAMDQFDALIIMGGPMSVHDSDLYSWLIKEKIFIKEAINHNKKILGICLGAQLIAEVLGASVFPNSVKEIGWFSVDFSKTFINYINEEKQNHHVFHWHYETFNLPTGAFPIASSQYCENQGFMLGENILALQFHIEMMRDNVFSIVKHCKDEIKDSATIQTEDEILNNESYFNNIHYLTQKIFCRFFAC